MNRLTINLKNCYGICKMNHEFDFTGGNPHKPIAKAYAVYAPNGLMKSSFAKTFEALSKGDAPREERYNRPSTFIVESDGAAVSKEVFYVLKAEIDIKSDSPAITNILVDPENKARYDQLLIDIEKLKDKLKNSLQKLSKVKKKDIEQTILQDWSVKSLANCVEKIQSAPIEYDLSIYEYATIFDPKTVEILKSKEFITNANEFIKRYQELFDEAGTIYQKGVFNPAKAETSFKALNNHGFFKGGHRVHLKGEANSIDEEELNRKLQEIHARIDDDVTLKKLHNSLAKNAKTQALTELIESLSTTEVEFLLENLKPDNQQQFRMDLWAYYIQKSPDSATYLEAYKQSKEEIDRIEKLATQAVPRWTEAVRLFNERFVNMPFTLSISNHKQAVLGQEKAELRFTFKDGADSVEWSRSELRTLSQGEKRALYLLNFIFEVEDRKIANQETLFIIDDVADSFDYKNKHAIIQYLKDLSSIEYFHQIILTHNYDFFRSLANSFVYYDRCLMANKNISSSEIKFENAVGIKKNHFIGIWKKCVNKNDVILCATIPFTRNLIEYIKGESDSDFLKLTSLLHWKEETDKLTVGEYLRIYNGLFGTEYDIGNPMPLKELLFTKATEICSRTTHEGLNLEDKVLLSIAIRMKSEILITNKLRVLKNDATYWCQDKNQFGSLIKELAVMSPNAPEIKILEKVSITVSSNIHLNSFMYEPILDLTIDHLINLYADICQLESYE